MQKFAHTTRHLSHNVITCFGPPGINQLMLRRQTDGVSGGVGLGLSWGKKGQLLVFWFRCVLSHSRTVQRDARLRATLTSFSSSSFSCLPSSELPHPPQNLLASLSPSHSHAVTLSWVRPFNGNSPVLRYIVELSENSKY